jgi:hypothetical protein
LRFEIEQEIHFMKNNFVRHRAILNAALNATIVTLAFVFTLGVSLGSEEPNRTFGSFLIASNSQNAKPMRISMAPSKEATVRQRLRHARIEVDQRSCSAKQMKEESPNCTNVAGLKRGND